MDTATKGKAKAMLDAGVDKDIIIETLNISLNDLENIDGTDATEEQEEKAPTTPNKITAENYDYYKNFISSWTGNVRDCFNELGISCPTFYRIQRTNSFEEYRDYSQQERERYLGRKTSKRVYMTKERFDAIKLGLSTWTGSDASYGRTAGISQATLSRVKRAKDYDEYARAKKAMNDAYKARAALNKQTAEAAKPVAVEPKQEAVEQETIEKTLAEHANASDNRMYIEYCSMADSLARIAEALEKIANKKRGLFRK